MRPAFRFDRTSIRAFAPIKGFVVYRVYGADGRLLYAGASLHPRERLLAHLRKGMPGSIVELQFCRNATAMARAEIVAVAEALVVGTASNATSAKRHGSWKAQKIHGRRNLTLLGQCGTITVEERA